MTTPSRIVLQLKSFLQGLPAGLDALATELVLGPLTQLNVNRRVERPYNDKLNLPKCKKPKQTHIFQNVAIPSISFASLLSYHSPVWLYFEICLESSPDLDWAAGK